MTPVLQTLDKLNHYIPQYSIRNETVSKWSIGMQIAHCLLAVKEISNTLIHSKPYTGKIKKPFLRQMIFLVGMIPRGRGKAPDATLPKEQITELELTELLAEAGKMLKRAAESAPDCWWKHFGFGVMKRDEALKFIAIHNKHHLKIIADILSRRPCQSLEMSEPGGGDFSSS